MAGDHQDWKGDNYGGMTPTQVALQLAKLTRRLQELTDDLEGKEMAAVEAKEANTLAFAKAFLSASGSNDVKKQKALEDTHDERLAAGLAEVQLNAAKSQIATLKVRIEVGRSASALVRAEADLLNVRR